jgi:hypothetical protein
MEQKNCLNSCEACGHILEGEYDLCPFCGYRLFDKDNLLKANQNSPPQTNPAPLPVENTSVTPAAEITDKEPKFQLPPDNSFSPILKSNKRKRWIILSALIFIFLCSASAVGYLNYSGAISLPFLKNSLHTKPTIFSGQQNIEKFYFCYASATTNNKRQVILSNVFMQVRADQTNATAISEFERYIRLRYPHDYKGFKPVICKNYATFDQAKTEHQKIQSGFTKKHYNLRHIKL